MSNVCQKFLQGKLGTYLKGFGSCSKVHMVLGFIEVLQSLQLRPFLAWLQLVGSCPGFPHGVIDPIEVTGFRP